MKKLFWKGVEYGLYAGGWLLVNAMMALDEISDAVGPLFRRRRP